jgi:hypothetical protein
MPSKRTAPGYFAPGEKAYETFLRADGWKSEYRSVQKLLNHLARRIKSEGSRECYLSWVHWYCRKVGKGPDEVVDAELLRSGRACRTSWTTPENAFPLRCHIQGQLIRIMSIMFRTDSNFNMEIS